MQNGGCGRAAFRRGLKEQDAVLARAALLASPGGRVVYITCSVLPEENDEAVERCRGATNLQIVDPGSLLGRTGLDTLAGAIRMTRHGLQMSPRLTATDGFFYVAVLRRPCRSPVEQGITRSA
jgi:16S rRNA (cytosine967-C5)-methyltransferase